MIDMSNPDAVRRELLDEDAAVRAEFAAHLEGELTELAEALAECFPATLALNEAAVQANATRTALVAAFALGVLDDLLVSTKLLLTGKLAAAGNLMRQVVEGIAMSILCSTDARVVIQAETKKKAVTACYCERLTRGDSLTQGHLALRQLEWNAGALGVNADAVARLHRAKDHYNGFSHCGTVTIASRVSLDGDRTIYVGGHFDRAKLETYRIEMNERIGLCRVLPPLLDRLFETMPRPVKPAAPAQQAEQA